MGRAAGKESAEQTRPFLHGPMIARAQGMRSRFQEIERQHRGEKGRRREDDVRDFLVEFLPARLAVGTGEIVASDGSQSPQIDLIVYDAISTPLLDRSQSSVVLPIEGVFAVIEVSSRDTEEPLDLSRLDKAERAELLRLYLKAENRPPAPDD